MLENWSNTYWIVSTEEASGIGLSPRVTSHTPAEDTYYTAATMSNSVSQALGDKPNVFRNVAGLSDSLV